MAVASLAGSLQTIDARGEISSSFTDGAYRYGTTTQQQPPPVDRLPRYRTLPAASFTALARARRMRGNAC